jgi:hypothetical protein
MPGAEARLRQRIRAALRAAHQHIVVWGMPASAFTGPGRADLFGAAYGRPFNLEVKTATGRTTPVQEIVLRECREAGSYAWVVRSPDQALRGLAWLRDHGERPPMPEEPLDIDDWFKALDEPINVEQAAPEPAPEPVTDHEFNFEPLSSPFTEAHHHAVEVVMNGPTTPQAVPVQTQDGGELLVTAMTQMTDVMRQIKDDLRTVGDRISMVFEQINRLEQGEYLVNQRLDRLFALVNDEELPEVDEVPAPPPVSEPAPIRRKRTQPSGRVRLQKATTEDIAF